jgi:hypothetical protein
VYESVTYEMIAYVDSEISEIRKEREFEKKGNLEKDREKKGF